MLPNQAIASTPSAPRPSGAEGRESTAPLCLQLLRTSQACTRYSAILLDITRHLPLLPQISSDKKCNNLVEASGNDNTLRSFSALMLYRALLPLPVQSVRVLSRICCRTCGRRGGSGAAAAAVGCFQSLRQQRIASNSSGKHSLRVPTPSCGGYFGHIKH
jgi:hypothetical protein